MCITKLFLLLPTPERYDELSWLAGSLCCALALVFMQMTGTMHPPAGSFIDAVAPPDITNTDVPFAVQVPPPSLPRSHLTSAKLAGSTSRWSFSRRLLHS